MISSVRLKRRAFADVDELFTYVKDRSGLSTAKSWRDGLLARIASLKDNALTWALSEDKDIAALGYRELLYRRYRYVYRIFYRVVGDEVFVHRIRSAFQDGLSAEDL